MLSPWPCQLLALLWIMADLGASPCIPLAPYPDPPAPGTDGFVATIDRLAEMLEEPSVIVGYSQGARLAHRFGRFALPGRGLGQARVRERQFGGDGQQLRQGIFAEDLIDALGGARDRRGGEHGMGGRNQLEDRETR